MEHIDKEVVRTYWIIRVLFLSTWLYKVDLYIHSKSLPPLKPHLTPHESTPSWLGWVDEIFSTYSDTSGCVVIVMALLLLHQLGTGRTDSPTSSNWARNFHWYHSRTDQTLHNYYFQGFWGMLTQAVICVDTQDNSCLFDIIGPWEPSRTPQLPITHSAIGEISFA